MAEAWVYTASTVVTVFMFHVAALCMALGMISDGQKYFVILWFLGALIVIGFLRETDSKWTWTTRKD